MRKTVRFTLRLDPAVMESVQKRAEKTHRSVNMTIERILRDRFGVGGNENIIIKSGSTYMWLNPNGALGEVTPNLYARFVNTGGVPAYASNRWDGAFTTMQQAIRTLGTPVCRWSDIGIIVMDIDDFIELNNKMQRKS